MFGATKTQPLTFRIAYVVEEEDGGTFHAFAPALTHLAAAKKSNCRRHHRCART
jgi:hypothetical protein